MFFNIFFTNLKSLRVQELVSIVTESKRDPYIGHSIAEAYECRNLAQ